MNTTKEKKAISTPFSRALRQLVDNSGIPIYKLAQVTGLGRSSIQHALSGYMFPTKEYLDTLVKALYLTPKQKNEIYELYLKETIGEGEYYNRQLIKKLIEEIDDFFTLSRSFNEPMTDSGAMQSERLIKGERAVIDGIIMRIGSTSPNLHDVNYIFTNIQHIPERLLPVFSTALNHSDNKTELIHFNKLVKYNSTVKNDNILVLMDTLQMMSYVGSSYKPYAYYTESESNDELISAFPFYIAAGNAVIQISADYSKAYIIDDLEYVYEYQIHCNKLMSLSSLILKTVSDMEKFNIFFSSSQILYQTIEYEPSLTQYFTLDIIDRYLPDSPIKDRVLAGCSDLLKLNNTRGFRFQGKCVFFSEDGLKYFAQTGILTSMPGVLLKPFSVEDRIYLLENLKSEIGIYLKMIKPSVLTIPKGFSLVGFTDNTALITYFTDKSDYICSLTEGGLCTSLLKYVDSMNEPDKCHDTEYTNRFIDELIDKLKRNQHHE